MIASTLLDGIGGDMNLNMFVLSCISVIAAHASLDKEVVYAKGSSLILADHTVWQAPLGKYQEGDVLEDLNDLVFKGNTNFVFEKVSGTVTENDELVEIEFGEGMHFSGKKLSLADDILIVKGVESDAIIDLVTGRLFENGLLYSDSDLVPKVVGDALYFEGTILILEDGSIWELEDIGADPFVKGDIVNVQGRYRKGVPIYDRILEWGDGCSITASFLGWLDAEASVLHAYPFSIQYRNGEEWDMYGHLSYLTNGKIAIGCNFEPYSLKVGQNVVSNTPGEESFCCLVDKDSYTILSMGAYLGIVDKPPVKRIVQEVTPSEYIFDDGFVLKYTMNPGLDQMDMLDKKFQFFFNPEKPFELNVKMVGDGDVSNIFVDGKDDLNIQMDCVVDLGNGDEWEQHITFNGSKELKEAFIPSGLQVGDTMLCYHIFSPILGQAVEKNFCFMIKQ